MDASAFDSGPALAGGCQAWSGRWGPSGPAWNLYTGDAATVTRGLPGGRYACAVTSPPYYWQRDYKVAGQTGLESKVEDYVDSVCNAMEGVRHVLHKRGLLFLNLGDTYYSGKGQPRGNDRKHNGRRMESVRAVDASGLGKPKKTLLGMPWRVALEMIDRNWILRSAIIWRRANPVPESNAADRPWRSYEHVFMFSKSRAYDFCRAALRAAGGEDVWTVESQSKAGRGHPAVFPAELVRRCLAIGNPQLGPVIDPFAGTGTALRVALEMGCDADGVELNPRYCSDIAASLSG